MSAPGPATRRRSAAPVVGADVAVARCPVAGSVVLALLLLAGPAWAHGPTGVEDYAWVDPPEGLARTVAPQGRVTEITSDLLAAGSADVWTPDLQALVSVEGDGPLVVSLTPQSPTVLPAPDGLEVSGNLYEVVLTGTVDEARVTLVPPHPTSVVLRWDGRGWRETPVAPGPDRQVTAPWDGPGPYVAAAPRLDGHSSTLDALAHGPLREVLYGVAIALLVADRLLRRRRAAAA